MNKEVENLVRVRKLIRKKMKFVLPKAKPVYSQQTIDYTEKESETWFNTFRGKNQAEITDSIFVESW